MYDKNGDLCFEEVDEDELALMMWSVPRRASVTAAHMDSMTEQNQQLRMELDQSLFAHQTDAERAKEITKQRDVQVQSEFRAMRAEIEKRQVEWAEKARVDKQRSDAALHEQQKESNVKWVAFVQQLQDDQAKCQKEVDDDYVHHVAELDKQRVQQEERHAEQQWRLHPQPLLQTQVSLCALPLHMQVCVPSPPSQLNGTPPQQ